MNPIRHTVTPDQLIVGAGLSVAADVHHLFAQLDPDDRLLNLTLAGDHTVAVSPSDSLPRVVVLCDSLRGLYVFGLLSGHADMPKTEEHALHQITQAVLDAAGAGGSAHGYRVEALLPTPFVPAQLRELPKLTKREQEIVRRLAAGLSDQAIAAQLRIKVGTVRYHLTRLYRKLGVTRRAEAIALALRGGFGQKLAGEGT